MTRTTFMNAVKAAPLSALGSLFTLAAYGLSHGFGKLSEGSYKVADHCENSMNRRAFLGLKK